MQTDTLVTLEEYLSFEAEAEVKLTEMSDDELLRMVRLDVTRGGM